MGENIRLAMVIVVIIQSLKRKYYTAKELVQVYLAEYFGLRLIIVEV